MEDIKVNCKIPVVIFAYDRPECLQRTLKALKNNSGVDTHPIIIFSDGPKENASNITKINSTRELIKKIDFGYSLTYYFSNSNLGLAESLTSGITRVLEAFNEVIVLEDDIVTSPYFLEFMRTALDIYKHDDRVISIAGFNYPIDISNIKEETFFLRGADCWGWGAWKRGWSLFEVDGTKLFNEICKAKLEREFDLNGAYPYLKMLKRTIAKNHSWAIKWHASAFLKEKFTLFPVESLVENIGGNGTNVKLSDERILGRIIRDTPIRNFESEFKVNDILKSLRIGHIRKSHSIKRKAAIKLKNLLISLTMLIKISRYHNLIRYSNKLKL